MERLADGRLPVQKKSRSNCINFKDCSGMRGGFEGGRGIKIGIKIRRRRGNVRKNSDGTTGIIQALFDLEIRTASQVM